MSVTALSALTVGGMPVLGSAGLLAMKSAETFFVDPAVGLDANEGTAEQPLQSLSEALSRCVSGRGDYVFLVGGPTSTSTTGHTARLSANLDWNKNNTHLIGICAPTMVGQRSRITGPSTGGTFSPLVTLSASGCRFENIDIFDDYTVDPVALKVTGSRNYFGNVNLQGMGAATGADDAAGASLWLAGASENTFERCTIGLDTIPRSTTNGEILFTSAASRNIFINCNIVSYCDNAGHLFGKAANSGDLDRYTIFDNCTFINMPTGVASGTTMTQAFNVHASAGGLIILKHCLSVGATDLAAADNGNVFVNYAYDGTQGTKVGGIAVAAVR